MHQDEDVGDEDGPFRSREPGEDVVGHDDAQRVVRGVPKGGVAWREEKREREKKMFWSVCVRERERGVAEEERGEKEEKKISSPESATAR